MAGPWEQFQQPTSAPAPQAAPTEGPWSNYAAPAAKQTQETPDFEPLIQQSSAKYGVPAELVRAVIGKESNFNPKAKSKKGAAGLMQLMPSTAADLGVSDVYDPAQNIDGGVRYLAQMLKKYDGDTSKALAAYNWGPGNVDKFGDNFTKVAPKETNDYVRKITAQMGINKPSGKPGDTTLAQDVARGASGFYRGLFQDLPDAVTQGMSAIIPDPVERFMDVEGKTGAERVAQQEADFQAKRKELGGEGVDVGRLAGNVVNPASLSLGVTGGVVGAGGKLAQLYAKLGPKTQALAGAMLRGGTAGAMQPVSGTEDFLGQKGMQIGTGLIAGPVAEGAGNLVVKGAGRLLGAGQNELQPGIAATQQLGREQGVQLTAGDLAPQNKILTGIEGGLENLRLPFASMSGTRATQQKQAQTAALKMLDDERAALAKVEYHGVDRLRKLASGNSIRSGEARKVLQMIDEAGPDERAIMQASGNNMWLTKKLSADKAFNEVQVLAGDKPVPATATLDAIDNALAQTGREIDLDPATQAVLRKWKSQLDSPQAGNIDDPIEAAVNQMEGTATGGEVIPNTYARMRRFRSDVRKRLDAATTNETTDSSKIFLKNIAAGIEDDLDNFAKTTPGLEDANARAQKWYRGQVVPYQKQKLAAALTSDDPDQIYGAFIRSQAEGRGGYAAERFFKALDNKGKQAVRYGIVKQAMEAATDGEKFSPTTFRKALLSTEYKTYFKGPDIAKVDKIIELFDHIKHADPAHLEKYSPIFGGMMGMGSMGIAGATGSLIAGSPVAAAGAAGLGIGGGKLLRWLMTSESGKRLLLSQNVFAKGGSKEGAGKLLEELVRRFSSATGTAAGAESGQPGRVLP